jgi:FemAB-related protein (PEP-CTERM system-associated)
MPPVAAPSPDAPAQILASAPTVTGSPPADALVSVSEATSGTAWNEFLQGHEAGTFYHRYEWAAINRDQFGHRSHLLQAVSEGRIVGALPLTLVSSAVFGRILCSMPFVNYGGPCARDAAVSASLVSKARELAADEKVKYLELRCSAPLATDLPASTRKISMSIELEADPEKIFEKYTSKHRTNIRRSYKNELTVKSGGLDLLPVFYSLMEESWRNLGTPLYAKKYFQRILETFPNDTRIHVCSRRDEPVAVAFNGEFNGTVEGMWAGGTAASRALQANYVLYWEMIQDACRRGLKRFHLGRSTADSGAEDFKKKWNATARQLYWYHHRPEGGAAPELNVDNPKFQLAINAWRRMPLWMTRIVGPRIAPGIP